MTIAVSDCAAHSIDGNDKRCRVSGSLILHGSLSWLCISSAFSASPKGASRSLLPPVAKDGARATERASTVASARRSLCLVRESRAAEADCQLKERGNLISGF